MPQRSPHLPRRWPKVRRQIKQPFFENLYAGDESFGIHLGEQLAAMSAGQDGRRRTTETRPECMARSRSALCHGHARSRGEPGVLVVTHATGGEARPGHDRRSVPGRRRDPTYKAGVPSGRRRANLKL
jgi:hypothetical protein